MLDIVRHVVDLLGSVNDVLHGGFFEIVPLKRPDLFNRLLLRDDLIKSGLRLINLDLVSARIIRVLQSLSKPVFVELLHALPHLSLNAFLLFDVIIRLAHLVRQVCLHVNLIRSGDRAGIRCEMRFWVLAGDGSQDLFQAFLLLDAEYKTLNLRDLSHGVMDVSYLLKRRLELRKVAGSDHGLELGLDRKHGFHLLPGDVTPAEFFDKNRAFFNGDVANELHFAVDVCAVEDASVADLRLCNFHLFQKFEARVFAGPPIALLVDALEPFHERAVEIAKGEPLFSDLDSFENPRVTQLFQTHGRDELHRSLFRIGFDAADVMRVRCV